MNTSNSPLSRKRQALFLAIIFALFFAFLELSYRVYTHLRYGLPLISTTADARADTVSATVDVPLVVANPLNHYVLNPAYGGHTADAFRWTPPLETAEREIICMGGSSTYGTSVTGEQAYPTRLQHHLNQAGPRFQVHNAGVPGWSLPHHIARYLFDLRNRVKRPAFIVLYIGYNDGWATVTRRDTAIGHSDMFRTLPTELPAWTHSRFLVWLISTIERVVGSDIAPTHLNDLAFQRRSEPQRPNPRNLERFERELHAFIQLLKGDGVVPLLVLQDNNGDFADDIERRLFDTLRERIGEIAGENDSAVLDMREVTRSNPDYFTDIIHMNARGNDARARAIAAKLLEMEMTMTPAAGEDN